ncbi:MAG: hypothetical protein AAF960_15815 [Bacteroidota bacterium]
MICKIDGLPALSVFGSAGINFLDGTPYFAISNPEVNAYYKYDDATSSVTKVFDMTGANIIRVVDLSATVQ